MTDGERRNVELYETLQIVTGLANHIISNMASLLEHDARLTSSEWQGKMRDWTNAWLHAQEVLTPGITKRD